MIEWRWRAALPRRPEHHLVGVAIVLAPSHPRGQPQPTGLPPAVAHLLDDPPSFDRAAVPAVNQRIVAFFVKNLGV